MVIFIVGSTNFFSLEFEGLKNIYFNLGFWGLKQIDLQILRTKKYLRKNKINRNFCVKHSWDVSWVLHQYKTKHTLLVN